MKQLYKILDSNPEIIIGFPSDLPVTGAFKVTDELWDMFLQQENAKHTHSHSQSRSHSHVPVPWFIAPISIPAPIPASDSETSSSKVDIMTEDWYTSSASSTSSASLALEISAPPSTLDNHARVFGDTYPYPNDRLEMF